MKQNNKKDQRSVWRIIIFSLIPLICLLLLTEILIRVVYFQYKHSTLGIVIAFDRIAHGLKLAIAKYRIGDYDLPESLIDALYSDSGKALLGNFQQLYEQNFVELYNKTAEIRSKFFVLYIPSDDYRGMKNIRGKNIAFFTELCKKYHVDFVDLTDRFMMYPTNCVTLLPEDGHLSRFGNILVADELSEFLKKYGNYRSDYHFPQRPALLGDLRRNSNSTWVMTDRRMPYNVITNSQGLRMDYDLEFPKKKQRILILGDSFTFGPYLPNHDTYPELLNKKYRDQDKEFVNAGVAGYTIDNETALFLERAMYAEPDITILQVLDNDLYDFFYFRRNAQNRYWKIYLPSPLERALIEEVKKANKSTIPR